MAGVPGRSGRAGVISSSDDGEPSFEGFHWSDICSSDSDYPVSELKRRETAKCRSQQSEQPAGKESEEFVRPTPPPPPCRSPPRKRPKKTSDQEAAELLLQFASGSPKDNGTDRDGDCSEPNSEEDLPLSLLRQRRKKRRSEVRAQEKLEEEEAVNQWLQQGVTPPKPAPKPKPKPARPAAAGKAAEDEEFDLVPPPPPHPISSSSSSSSSGGRSSGSELSMDGSSDADDEASDGEDADADGWRSDCKPVTIEEFTDPFIGQTGFKDTMAVNRFDKLAEYTHLSDRSLEPAKGTPGYSRLYKLTSVIDTFGETFKRAYTVGKAVSIDESMIAYTGALSFKQYMPAKPIKRGVKLWVRADSQSAYLDRFKIYLGREEGGYPNGLGFHVVETLTNDILQTNRQIYMDNFFSSVILFRYLLANGLYACGTARQGRTGFPREIVEKSMIRGDSVIKQQGQLTACAWKDRKHVTFLSTCSQPTEFDTVTRKTKAGVIEIDRPSVVNDYNKYMGGVDRNDQLRATYGVGYSSGKWWKTVFFALVNVAVVNAFILYKATSRRTVPVKRYRLWHFRLELAKQLIHDHALTRAKKTSKKEVVIHSRTPRPVGHHLSTMPRRGRCLFCQSHNKRRETMYGCLFCDMNLCRVGCFIKYHSILAGANRNSNVPEADLPPFVMPEEE